MVEYHASVFLGVIDEADSLFFVFQEHFNRFSYVNLGGVRGISVSHRARVCCDTKEVWSLRIQNIHVFDRLNGVHGACLRKYVLGAVLLTFKGCLIPNPSKKTSSTETETADGPWLKAQTAPLPFLGHAYLNKLSSRRSP
jgi:hypothetical protein